MTGIKKIVKEHELCYESQVRSGGAQGRLCVHSGKVFVKTRNIFLFLVAEGQIQQQAD